MMNSSAEHVQHWDKRYLQQDTPWDTGVPSRELIKLLDSGAITPGRAIDLGCGTGTNAIELARRGFDVIGIDCSQSALSIARKKALDAGAHCEFLFADLLGSPSGLPHCDFLFDRGCYHCVRRKSLDGMLGTLKQITRPGTIYQLLVGNAREPMEQGPPVMTDRELRDELGELFELLRIEEFRFEDPGGVVGPLGWSTVWRRRDSSGD